jgi:hypothetical protein
MDSMAQLPHKWIFTASLVCALLHTALVLFFVWQRIGELDFLRLHYTAQLGVDWIDAWWYIFVFPALGWMTLVVNMPLGLLFHRYHAGYSGMMAVATLMIEIGLLAAGIFALLLNI